MNSQNSGCTDSCGKSTKRRVGWGNEEHADESSGEVGWGGGKHYPSPTEIKSDPYAKHLAEVRNDPHRASTTPR